MREFDSSCSGLSLEVQLLRKLSLELSSKPNTGAAHWNFPLVNGHNILAYCNGRPPEWWTLTAYHSFPTVFRQPLDGQCHQGLWPNARDYINTPRSKGSGTIFFNSSCFTLFTDLSVGAPAGTQSLPFTGTEQSNRKASDKIDSNHRYEQ
jgi:hypothetical protein